MVGRMILLSGYTDGPGGSKNASADWRKLFVLTVTQEAVGTLSWEWSSIMGGGDHVPKQRVFYGAAMGTLMLTGVPEPPSARCKAAQQALASAQKSIAALASMDIDSLREILESKFEETPPAKAKKNQLVKQLTSLFEGKCEVAAAEIRDEENAAELRRQQESADVVRPVDRIIVFGGRSQDGLSRREIYAVDVILVNGRGSTYQCNLIFRPRLALGTHLFRRSPNLR